MTKNATEEILEKIQLVLREQFKEPKLQIDLTTQANDVVGWDSLRNIEIFINLEKEFKVKFSGTEIIDLENIGDIIHLIIKKKSKS